MSVRASRAGVVARVPPASSANTIFIEFGIAKGGGWFAIKVFYFPDLHQFSTVVGSP